VSPRVIREAKINNSHHKYDGVINLILGDSLTPPLRKQAIQQVVSDPPYAMQTTTKGIDPIELFTKWSAVQDKGTTVVVTLPSTMPIQINDDWEEEFAISDFVHKSLIRVARKLKKVN
jgi:tRNA G10  N-methylase Trm11